MQEEQSPRRKITWNNKKLFFVLTILLVLAAIAAAGAIYYVYFIIHPYGQYDKILPNVYCAGVDLSGMTQEEAQAAIEDALRYPSHHVKVILPDGEYTFQPAQEGVTLNAQSIARKAYAYGRSDPSAFGIYNAYQNARRTEYRLSPETALNYSREDVEAQAREISEATYIAPTESAVSCDTGNHTVTVTPGKPGRVIQPQAMYSAVCAAFNDLDFSDIILDYDKVEIDLEALAALCRDSVQMYHITPVNPVVLANHEDHTIDLTMGTLGWELDGDALYAAAADAVARGDYGEITLEMASIQPEDVDITAAYHELAADPTEPYYYAGAVHDGSYGYVLDWDSAIASIYDAAWGEQLSIPMLPVPPQHTAADYEAVLFRDRLSSYSTAHTSNANRTNNLTLACQAINGTVINPGEIFSFNGIVGQRTSAKGYKTATVYVGSESQEELGGGICQVASTIYDAALYAEMEITSRDCHTFLVTYVPGGLDATVYWDGLDFSFRNSTEYPIRVNASVSGGYVNISIDGTKTNDHVVKLSSSQISSTPYTTVYRHDSSKPAGYQSVTTSPYTGYSYDAYQYIYDGSGNLLESNYLGRSYYEKRDQVITIGTG